jgi:hypothetical protein
VSQTPDHTHALASPGAVAAADLGINVREIPYRKVSSLGEAPAAPELPVATVTKSQLIRRGKDAGQRDQVCGRARGAPGLI